MLRDYAFPPEEIAATRKVLRYLTCLEFVASEGEGGPTMGIAASFGLGGLSIQWGYHNPAGTAGTLKNIDLHRSTSGKEVSECADSRPIVAILQWWLSVYPP